MGEKRLLFFEWSNVVIALLLTLSSLNWFSMSRIDVNLSWFLASLKEICVLTHLTYSKYNFLYRSESDGICSTECFSKQLQILDMNSFLVIRTCTSNRYISENITSMSRHIVSTSSTFSIADVNAIIIYLFLSLNLSPIVCWSKFLLVCSYNCLYVRMNEGDNSLSNYTAYHAVGYLHFAFWILNLGWRTFIFKLDHGS